MPLCATLHALDLIGVLLLLFCFGFFETGLLCVALAALELTL